MADSKVFIIAEAGVNHNGDVEKALELVRVAAKAGADAVKFQTFNPDLLVTEHAATAEYQKDTTGADNQYEMLKSLVLSESDYDLLIAECAKTGIEFMSTPFDFGSAKFLEKLGVQRLKVPSGELNNIPFLKQLATIDLPLILSTGMGTLEEVQEAVACITTTRKELGYKAPIEEVLTVLHCTSNYPAKAEDVNLKAMLTMKDALPGVPVGYSDHTLGIEISIASVAMGGTMVEKHFTLDKTLPGPDHRASLEPQELDAMVSSIRNVEAAFGDGVKAPRPSELPVRDIARRSLSLAADIEAGKPLTEADIVITRPATGIQPKELEAVIGKSLKAAQLKGTTLNWDMLS